MQVFDNRRCTLGEGPLWHPERGTLFWFDIKEKRLMKSGQVWQFSEHVSAAGWLGRDALLIASETALFRFDIETGAREDVCALEPDLPGNRSNDGRADPLGGFWIGTMGLNLEDKAGAIYRYYKGELRKLYGDITVSNSICFSPDGLWAYFADTKTYKIQRVALDGAGWPKGDPEVFVDLSRDRYRPDGSVVDAQGRLWNAQYGAGRVVCYGPEGEIRVLPVPARQTTCPAFGGPDLETLYVTSAGDGLDGDAQGLTYVQAGVAKGQAEHKVLL